MFKLPSGVKIHAAGLHALSDRRSDGGGSLYPADRNNTQFSAAGTREPMASWWAIHSAPALQRRHNYRWPDIVSPARRHRGGHRRDEPDWQRQACVRASEIGMAFQDPRSSFSRVHMIGNQVEEVIRLHMGLNKKQGRVRAVEILGKVGIRNPEATVDQYSFNGANSNLDRVRPRSFSCPVNHRNPYPRRSGQPFQRQFRRCH